MVQHTFKMLLPLLWLTWCAAPAHSQEAAWEVRPYRVQLLVAASDSPAWTDARLKQIKTWLEADARLRAGGPWQAVVADAPAAIARLARVDVRRLDQATLDSPEFDKVIVIAPRVTAGGITVDAREWDTQLQLWGLPATRTAPNMPSLRHALFAAAAAAFSPVLQVTRVEEGEVILRARAGSLPARSDAIAYPEGRVLRLIDQSGQAAKPAEWTYLVVTSSEDALIKARPYSRYKNPLAALERAPSQWTVMGVSAMPHSTQLQLTKLEDSAPLAGCEVLSYPPLEGETQSLGVTDSQGRLAIPPARSPLRILLVRRGTQLLARLPLLPGSQPQLAAAISAAEASPQAAVAVAAARARLFDLIAENEILIARARARATAEEMDAARKLLDEIQQGVQTRRQKFEEFLNQQRQKVAADGPADPAAQKALDDLLNSLAKYLDERVNNVVTELAAAGQPLATDPGGAAPATGGGNLPSNLELSAPVNTVAFSHDGKLLAAGDLLGLIQIWDLQSGQPSQTLQHGQSVGQVAFSPDNQKLISAGGDGSSKIWDVAGGKELATLAGHARKANCAAFSPDGAIIATGSDDGVLKLFNGTNNGLMRNLTPHGGPVWGVAFAPSGAMLASAGSNQIKLLNPTSGAEIRTLMGHQQLVRSVAFSSDSKRLVSGSDDSLVKIWDVEQGGELKTLSGHTGPVWKVDYSPDGTLVASAGQDNTARIWNVESGEAVRTIDAHEMAVKTVAFSPGGNVLATGSEDKTVRLHPLK